MPRAVDSPKLAEQGSSLGGAPIEAIRAIPDQGSDQGAEHGSRNQTSAPGQCFQA